MTRLLFGVLTEFNRIEYRKGDIHFSTVRAVGQLFYATDNSIWFYEKDVRIFGVKSFSVNPAGYRSAQVDVLLEDGSTITLTGYY